MIVCPSCGHENSDPAKFCEACATPLAPAPAAREQRKTVTVLFCDVTGSTALGGSTDPEALRALLACFFERMKGIVEAHGGHGSAGSRSAWRLGRRRALYSFRQA
jgi:class 3 adenylate cyclase